MSGFAPAPKPYYGGVPPPPPPPPPLQQQQQPPSQYQQYSNNNQYHLPPPPSPHQLQQQQPMTAAAMQQQPQQAGYGYHYGQQQQAPPPQQQSQSPQGPYGFNLPQPPRPDPEAQKREDELRSWFVAVDQRGTGKIDAESLRAALSSSGSAVKASTAERLIKMFDKNSSGESRIEYNEFKAAHLFIQQMANGFRQNDLRKSGQLEADEVRRALEISGYHLSGPSHDLLMKKFGTPRNGQLALDFGSYIDLSILLGQSARVFGFYDKNQSGLVTFDYNTFFVALLASTQ